MSWNHNIYYHRFVISQLPPGCQRTLDVGCGQGTLARKLAAHSREVVGADLDKECVDRAGSASHSHPNLTFLHGDVLTQPLQSGSFDSVVAIATLHHLPLSEAFDRFRDLLRPGGVLVVVTPLFGARVEIALRSGVIES